MMCLCALEWEAAKEGNFYKHPNYEFTLRAFECCILTLFFRLALHFQVHGGEAELVAVLSSQLLLLQAVAHTEATAHCGHLAVELLPCDFVVKAQPVELNLHTEKAEEESGMKEWGGIEWE